MACLLWLTASSNSCSRLQKHIICNQWQLLQSTDTAAAVVALRLAAAQSLVWIQILYCIVAAAAAILIVDKQNDLAFISCKEAASSSGIVGPCFILMAGARLRLPT